MWRASGTAVEVGEDVNKMTLRSTMAQQVKTSRSPIQTPRSSGVIVCYINNSL